MNALNLFEANIVYWIQNHLRAGFLTPVMQVITALGNGGAFWIVLTVLLLLFKKTRRAGLCCALALVLDLLAVNIALKPIVARVRPYDVVQNIRVITSLPGDHSFPSGHTWSAVTGAWVATAANRKFGWVAIPLAAALAFSRLYLYVHFPSDILMGALIGAALGILAVVLQKRLPAKPCKC